MSDPLAYVPSGSDAWTTLKALASSVDQKITFEHETRPRPPLVCKPMMEYDRYEDEIGSVCRIHQEQWWPCQAFRGGRGVQEQGPETVQVLVMRPRVAGPSYGALPSPDLLFTELPEAKDA